MAHSADVLLLCGDLTDLGTPEEAEVLVRELSVTGHKPKIAVLGNHDFHSGREADVVKVMTDAGVAMLDGDSRTHHGVGFAGVKGFGGGFGHHTLEPWGESGIKKFVYEAVEQTLRLESGLARLRTTTRIAVLHYAPIQATVEGEPPPIFPFLGSSRLEEPLNRYPVTAAFHGHAHRGQPEGRTKAGVPVYNVSLPLLRRAFPDRPPFRVLELDVVAPVAMPEAQVALAAPHS
jgi:Icc-related predicted phosphoesterase